MLEADDKNLKVMCANVPVVQATDTIDAIIKLMAGETLTVYLNSGNTKVAEVPDVVGQKEVDAKAMLIAAKLTNYDTKLVYSDTVPAGVVMAQSETAGTKIDKSKVVVLTVSSGPEPTPSPSPSPVPDTPTPVPDTPTPVPDNSDGDSQNGEG